MKITNFNVYGGQVNLADRIDKIEFNAAFSKEQFLAFTAALNLSDTRMGEVVQVYQDVDQLGLEESKATVILQKLEQQLDAIKSQLPAPVVHHLDEAKKLQPGMSLDGKFKTVIPIIPFILSYELEAKSNLKDVFKQIWTDIKNGEIFLKKKG
mgnify:CR=1 FL=1